MNSNVTTTATSIATTGTTPPCWLVTVPVLATIYGDAKETEPGIRANIFKAEDRLNSRGERIAGNGLAAHGAIVRRGRKVLIDVHRYGNWLAGRPPVNG